MPRSAWASQVDEQAATTESMLRRVAALENSLAQLQPGPWVYVGATVNGIVGPAWTSPWQNYDASTFVASRFRMEAGGEVFMEVAASTGVTGMTNGASMWTMPTAFRPTRNRHIKVRTTPAAAPGFEMLQVASTGTLAVFCDAASGVVAGAAPVVVLFTARYSILPQP